MVWIHMWYNFVCELKIIFATLFFFSIRTAERLNFYCYQKFCWLFPVVVNDGSVCRAVKKSKVELTLSYSTEANTTVQADLA